MGKEPAYLTVYYKLKSEIRDNEYEGHEFLPTEPELEKKFGVSRTTIRKAIEMLARDGYLRVTQGRGTEILDFSVRQDLNIVTSISETLKKRGFTVRAKNPYIDEITADAALAKELRVNEGDPLVRFQRIQMADEEPVVIMKNYIVKERVPDFANKATNIDSLYQFLEDEYSIAINSAQDTIFAKAADFTDAEMLQVTPGSPLLCIRRVSYANDVPITADRINIRYDRYELQVKMVGRQAFLDYI